MFRRSVQSLSRFTVSARNQYYWDVVLVIGQCCRTFRLALAATFAYSYLSGLILSVVACHSAHEQARIIKKMKETLA